MILLSIVVPIYNVEKYLEKCIESILNQSFIDFEIILVDDGSTDKSGIICDEYSKKDSRIKVIHKENKGVSSARNTGINEAIGKYVAFVDPDDTIHFKKYEIMLNECLKNDLDMVVCQIKTINTKLNIEKISNVWNIVNCKIDKDNIEKRLIPDILTKGQFSMASSVNKVYKMQMIIESNIRFDEKRNHGEDSRFNWLLLQKISSIEFIDKPLYEYYIRDRVSLTRIFNKDRYNEILDNRNFGLNLCKKYNILNIDEYNQTYINNTINFIQELIKSDLVSLEKKHIFKNVIDSKELKSEIVKYKEPSIYYYMLKLAMRMRNYLLIKTIILVKEKVYGIYRRNYYEN